MAGSGVQPDVSSTTPHSHSQSTSTSKAKVNTPSTWEKPWYTYLTLDLVLLVLSKSIFHPFIVFVFYLSLLGSHRHKVHPRFTVGLLWYALFLCTCRVLGWGNRRMTYGPPRPRSGGGDEVVVVTGGASGLGRCLTTMFARRGVGVAVLDVSGPDEEMEEMLVENGGCVKWYSCDVGKIEEVKRVREMVEKDAQAYSSHLVQLGQPTILINNAASGINGLPLCSGTTSSYKNQPLLSPPAISNTITTNILGHFNTLTTFLPAMSSLPTGCTIITISSILAHLAPANLTDYAASKAAVSSLHHTLTNEIRQRNRSHRVKTVLVEVGQMATDLFAEVETPWYAKFVGPTLEVKDVAKEIVRLVDEGQGGVVRMPAYAKCMVWYAVFPGSVQRGVRWFAGIDGALVGDGRRRQEGGTQKLNRGVKGA